MRARRPGDRGARPGLRRAAGLALAALLAAGPASGSPAARQREGLRALAEGRAEEALARFEEAERDALAAGRDPAAARYNQGLALARLGRDDAARERLSAALETGDLSLQARAHYALGTLEGARADAAALEEARLAEAAAAYEASLRSLESSLRLAAGSEDAQVNHELARTRLDAVRRRIEESPPPDPDAGPEPEPGEPEPGEPPDPPAPDGEPEAAPDEGAPDGEPEAAERAEEPDGEMTREEARMILDALREEEEMYRARARILRGEPEPVDRDW